MTTFDLTIATATENLFQGEVTSAVCPGSEGELTILAHHSSLITTLKKGVLHITTEESEDKKRIEIDRGLLEVGNNQATILV